MVQWVKVPTKYDNLSSIPSDNTVEEKNLITFPSDLHTYTHTHARTRSHTDTNVYTVTHTK